MLRDPSILSYLALRVRIATPVNIGEGPTSMRGVEIVVREKEILRLNPTNRRSELESQELNKDDVSKLLALVGTIPVFFVPVAQNPVEFRRRCLIIYDLCIVTGNIEGFCDEIRDVFPDEHVRD